MMEIYRKLKKWEYQQMIIKNLKLCKSIMLKHNKIIKENVFQINFYKKILINNKKTIKIFILLISYY